MSTVTLTVAKQEASTGHMVTVTTWVHADEVATAEQAGNRVHSVITAVFGHSDIDSVTPWNAEG